MRLIVDRPDANPCSKQLVLPAAGHHQGPRRQRRDHRRPARDQGRHLHDDLRHGHDVRAAGGRRRSGPPGQDLPAGCGSRWPWRPWWPRSGWRWASGRARNPESPRAGAQGPRLASGTHRRSGGRNAAKPSDHPARDQRSTADDDLHIKTTGMHCPSCPMLIELSVRDLPGVATSGYRTPTARPWSPTTSRSVTQDASSTRSAMPATAPSAPPSPERKGDTTMQEHEDRAQRQPHPRRGHRVAGGPRALRRLPLLDRRQRNGPGGSGPRQTPTRPTLLHRRAAAGVCAAAAPAAAPAAARPPQSEGAAALAGDVQKISVSVGASGYNPNVIKLKAGVPAEITFGQSSGCTGIVQSQQLGFQADLTAGRRRSSCPRSSPAPTASPAAWAW